MNQTLQNQTQSQDQAHQNTTTSPSPSPLKPTLKFTTSPHIPPTLLTSPRTFLSHRPELSHLLAGALIFRPHPQTRQTQTLILRRAASDSYPLKWEKPGGSVSKDDESVLSCVAREVWEETGLHVKSMICPVGLGLEKGPGPGNWGVQPEMEMAEELEGDEARTIAIWESGRRWAVVTVVVEVYEDLGSDGVDGREVVRVDPREHAEWKWVTEEEVRDGRDVEGGRLEFIGRTVWGLVLEGFRVWRELHREEGMEGEC